MQCVSNNTILYVHQGMLIYLMLYLKANLALCCVSCRHSKVATVFVDALDTCPLTLNSSLNGEDKRELCTTPLCK